MADLSGWGHNRTVKRPVLHLERLCDLPRDPDGTLARGMGRSYGDASLAQAVSLDTRRFTRYLDMTSDGLLTVECGVTIGDLVQTWLPRGWFVPVTPGTQWVTVGGAIAADVHGKNHHQAGSFAKHVESMSVWTGQEHLALTSPNQPAWQATVGGMGLTGLVTRASLRMAPVETGYLVVDYVRTPNLADTLRWFEEHDDAPYTVAWIDTLAEGSRLGRSVIMAGRHARPSDLAPSTPPYPTPRRRVRVPARAPDRLLGTTVGRLFNEWYYQSHKPARGVLEPWWSFYYPLDVVDDWYRLYGRRGFTQIQFVVPSQHAEAVVAAVLGRLRANGVPSFLGVLKKMGEPSDGMLGFPMPGYTLALDVPMTPSVQMVAPALHRLVADVGGRMYLAKDSLLTPSEFRAMYPRWQEFAHERMRISGGRWRSELSRRLGLDKEDQ